MSFRDDNEETRNGLKRPFIHTGSWYRMGSRQSSMMDSSQVIRDSFISVLVCVLIVAPGPIQFGFTKANGVLFNYEISWMSTAIGSDADLYGNGVWARIETPANSGNFVTNKTTFSCASVSPMKCSDSPAGYVFSFGEDNNNKDIYLLTSNGVYRVIKPSRCNLSCSKENSTAVRRNHPGPTISPSSSSSSCYRHMNSFRGSLVVLMVYLSLILLGLLV
ncbi:unnamed protein product [Cochlearia groenlandica]